MTANAATANAPVSANATSEKKDEVVRVVHGMKFTSEDAAELHGLLASAGKGATGGTKGKLGLVRIRIFRGRARSFAQSLFCFRELTLI